MKNLILVFVGGGFGSCCRYLISILLNSPVSYFPLGTFMANILSCLVLGFTSFIALERLELSDNIRFLIMTGFCGGFSTFSTFDSEILTIIKSGNYSIGIIYAVFSILMGIGALLSGMALANKLI